MQAAPERELNPSGKPAAGRSWAEIRRDFDILDQNVQMKPLVYLDSAATSQKPQAVVAKMSDYYRRYTFSLLQLEYKHVGALPRQAFIIKASSRHKLHTFRGLSCQVPQGTLYLSQ